MPGALFEVTPDNSIVWEYYSPERTGPDDVFIAQIFEMKRIAPESVPWLNPLMAHGAEDKEPVTAQ